MLKELPETQQSTRLKAVISLLALQGLRQIEITRLDVRDVDFVSKTAFVKGKGQDDKEPISLHPETIKHLREYLKINQIKDGALFTSQSNNHKNKRLTTRALRQLVKETLNDLGIEKTIHGFRHFFTTTLIKTYKGDLLEVAQYTRHKSLEMLQVYNDNIKKEADLPRYYKAFNRVSF
jgi:integrase